MTVRLHADGATGKLAIYNYSGSDAPFTAPLSNISSLLFHSDLRSISITGVQTGTATLPVRSANTSGRAAIALFAHGKAGFPYVEGRITSIGGVGISRPLVGSVPVVTQTQGYARLVHLGADSTFVYLHEVYAAEKTTAYAGLVLGYEVYVSDVLL